MELDVKIIGSLIAIAASAIIGSAAYFFKTRNENRKSIRKILYFLLEIRHSLRWHSLDADLAADEFIRHCAYRLSSKWHIDIQSIQADVRLAIQNHLQNLFDSIRPVIDEDLVSRFHTTLIDLAQSHPVLSYQLRGKEHLKDAYKVTDEYERLVVQATVEAITDPSVKTSLRTAGKSFKATALNEMIGVLDSDIKRLAWASGIPDWIRCHFLLRENSRKSQFDIRAINDAIDELANILTSVETAVQKVPTPA